MKGAWLTLTDLPAEGREFSFSDQEAQDVWGGYFREFQLDVRPGRPMEAIFTVLPHTEDGLTGVLVRGRLQGSVILPCSRCTCDVEHEVDLPFEFFEELGDAESGESQFLRREGENLELNPGEMLWEEFSLNLPGRVLCAADCQGLCPACGCNRNAEQCACAQAEGDPRMAVLRGLKIVK